MRRLWVATGAALLAAVAVAVGHATGKAHPAAAGPVIGQTAAGRPATSASPAGAPGTPCPPYEGLGLLTACVDVHLTGPLTLTGRVRTYLPTTRDSPPRTCRDHAKGLPDGYGGLLFGVPDLLDPRKSPFGTDKHGQPVFVWLMDDLHGHSTLQGHTLTQAGSIPGYKGSGEYTHYDQTNTSLDGHIYNTAYARQVTVTVTPDGGGRLLATGMPRLNVNAVGDFLSYAPGPKLTLDMRWTCTGQIPTPAEQAAHGRYRQR